MSVARPAALVAGRTRRGFGGQGYGRRWPLIYFTTGFLHD